MNILMGNRGPHASVLMGQIRQRAEQFGVQALACSSSSARQQAKACTPNPHCVSRAPRSAVEAVPEPGGHLLFFV
jgi:hypothetical protein